MSQAEKMLGVLTILHHGKSGQLYRPAGSLEEMSRPGESRPPFEDDNIYYYGQYVALVVADTFEQAQDAAFHVKVSYRTNKPLVRLNQSPMRGQSSNGREANVPPPNSKYARGDAESAYQQAPVKLDYTYITPVETHNPMEMHGTIAVWEGNRLNPVRIVARRGEPSQCRLASTGYAARKHRRRLPLHRIRLRMRTLSLATFLAGGYGRQEGEPSGTIRDSAHTNVHHGRPPSFRRAADSHRRNPRRQAHRIGQRHSQRHFVRRRILGRLRGSHFDAL